MTHSSDVELKKRPYDLDFRVVCISISHAHGNWLGMFPAWHSIIIAQPCWTYTYPCSQEFAKPCWIGQPCWTYSCSSLDTGPCSTLLDIPLLIPAGYTIAHTGTYSTLQVLAQPCWTQALAQPCWKYYIELRICAFQVASCHFSKELLM